MDQQRFYYINSKNRLSGTSSNFTYSLNITNLEADYCLVTNMTIPKSYYLVNETNYRFTLVESGGSFEVSLAYGNYTRKNFASNLTTALTTAGTYTYVVSYDSSTQPDTGKYTFTVSNNSSFQPSFIFTNELNEQLGFDENSTNTFVANVLVSRDVINLQVESTLFVHCDFVHNGTNNILQEIYVNGSSNFSAVTYSNNSLELSNKMNNLSPVISIWLTDENGKPINLNGQNMQLTLFVYKKDETITNTARLMAYEIMNK